jgi:hypothetical protein
VGVAVAVDAGVAVAPATDETGDADDVAAEVLQPAMERAKARPKTAAIRRLPMVRWAMSKTSPPPCRGAIPGVVEQRRGILAAAVARAR